MWLLLIAGGAVSGVHQEAYDFRTFAENNVPSDQITRVATTDTYISRTQETAPGDAIMDFRDHPSPAFVESFDGSPRKECCCKIGACKNDYKNMATYVYGVEVGGYGLNDSVDGFYITSPHHSVPLPIKNIDDPHKSVYYLVPDLVHE